MIVVVAVLAVALIAGVVAVALWLVNRQSGAEIPAGWVRAEFQVAPAAAGLELSPEIRDDVGLMLVGRLQQRGVPEARYEVRADRVEVGVPPGQESALADLREMSVTTTVELRLVTGEESTPDGCVPDAEIACALDGLTGYRLGPTEIDGTALSDARAQLDERGGGWTVVLTWTGAGQQSVEQVTAAHVGEQLAISANGVVVAAPQILDAITGDSMLVSGSFNRDEAEHLAAEFRLGRLPVSITGDHAG